MRFTLSMWPSCRLATRASLELIPVGQLQDLDHWITSWNQSSLTFSAATLLTVGFLLQLVIRLHSVRTKRPNQSVELTATRFAATFSITRTSFSEQRSLSVAIAHFYL